MTDTGVFTATASDGSLIVTGDLVTNSTVNLTASEQIEVADIAGTGILVVNAGTDISFGTIEREDIRLLANGDVSGIAALSDTSTGFNDRVQIQTSGAVDVGTILAIQSIDIDGDTVSVGSLTSEAIDVRGTGALDVGNVAGTSATIIGASVTIDGANLTSALTIDAVSGNLIANDSLTAAGPINLDAAGIIQLADINGSGVVDVDAGSDLSFGAIDARDITLLATGVISGTSAISDMSTGFNDRVLIETTGPVDIGTIVGLQSIRIDGTAINVNSLDSQAITIIGLEAVNVGSASGGSATIVGTSVEIDAVDLTSFLTLNAISGNLIATGPMSAVGTIDLDASGAIQIADVTGGGVVNVNAGGDLDFGAVVARDITLLAGGNVTGNSTLSQLSTGFNDRVTVDAGGDIDICTVFAVQNVALTGVDITTDAINGATGNVIGSGTLRLGDISGGSMTVRGANVSLASVDLSSAFTAEATAQSLAINGPLSSGSNVDLDAQQAILIGDVTALSGSFSANAGGDIQFGDLTGRNIVFVAGGNIVGSSAVSPDSTGFNDRVVLQAAGNVDVGTAVAVQSVDVDGANITLGTIQSPTGTIETPGDAVIENMIGNPFAINARNITLNNADVNVGLSLSAPGFIRSNGTITANGDISFDAGSDILVTNLEPVRDVTLIAGADVAVQGFVSGDHVAVTGTDLEVTAGAQLGDGPGTQSISIFNIGSLPTFLGNGSGFGDGIASTGFSIGNAEFSRIQAIGLIDITSTQTRLRIGDLTLQGTAFGSGTGTQAISLFAAGVISVEGDLLLTRRHRLTRLRSTVRRASKWQRPDGS